MLALVSVTIGAPSATPPTFAKDFYVGQQSSLAINQGGYVGDKGTCCSLEHASQCKVQASNMGADLREQGSQDRSRTDSARGSIVNWWGNVKKQMAIVPGSAVNSSHKWACAQYCPLDGEFYSAIKIGDGQKGFFDKPKDLGQATITQPKSIGGASKTCEHWRWTETLLRIVPMSTTNFYVDNSVQPPEPFFSSQVIKPFNKPLGMENSSFIGYKAMDVSDSFDLDPDSVANCQKSDQCQDNQQLNELSPTMAALIRTAPTAYDRAKILSAAVQATRSHADPPAPPAADRHTYRHRTAGDADPSHGDLTPAQRQGRVG